MKAENKLINKQTLTRAETFLHKCSHLGPVVKLYGRCELFPAKQDPFDTLISSIVAQQLSVKAANTIEARVKKLTGEPCEAEKLLSVSKEDLRECGLSYRKADYITGLAQAFLDKSLDFEALTDLPDSEVIRELTRFRGVGQWTAEMHMIFSLGRMDIFSSSDVGLQRGMKHLFGDAAASLAEMEKIAERWQPYRSVASWYLWKIVD